MAGAHEVEVRAHFYLNPSGRCDGCRMDINQDPGCCDESTIITRSIDETCPVVQCDTSMIICSRPVDSTVELTGVTCQDTNINIITGPTLFYDTISLNFSEASLFFGIENPLVISLAQAWVVSS